MRLARAVSPRLRACWLGEVLRHCRIPRLANRHCTMPGADVTSEVFRCLIADGPRRGAAFTELGAAAALQPRAVPPARA